MFAQRFVQKSQVGVKTDEQEEVGTLAVDDDGNTLTQTTSSVGPEVWHSVDMILFDSKELTIRCAVH